MNDKLNFSRLIAGRINSHASQLKPEWCHITDTPTRHFIVDNLLPEELAARIYGAFPKSTANWVQRDTFRERKKSFAKLESVDSIIGSITDAFHTNEVLQAIQGVTGLDGLEADPELYAGGISMMGKGDFLNPHIDNSHDAKRERYRRLNLLYYISPGWELDFGGNFELWDEHVVRPKVVQSKCNRLVVMETNRISWHSVNPVLVDRERCCISNYYFSKQSPGSRHYYHVTSFTGRPNQRLARIWGRIDNPMRQWIAQTTKTSRGKSLARYK